MRRSPRLPKRFPVGTKYILESYGGFVRRYIEYPSGRRIELETRKALSCGCFDSSIVPERGADTLNSEPEKFKRSLISLLGRTRERKNGYGLIPSEATSDWAYFIGSAPRLVPSPLPLYAPRLFCKLHDRYTKKEFTNCTRFSHPRSRNFANGTMLG